MDNVTISSTKRTRKPRTSQRSEAELEQQLLDTKNALRQLRKRDREQSILTLGTLAYKAGLGTWDSEKLFAAFQELARNGMLALCLVCIATVSTCCMLGEQFPQGVNQIRHNLFLEKQIIAVGVHATLTTPPGPRCWYSPDDGAHCLV